MDDNPYASPLAEDETESKVSESDLTSARRRVIAPAIALCIVAGLGLFLDAFNLFMAVLDTFRFADPWIAVLVNVGGNMLIAFLHVAVLLGGLRMRRLQTYSTAMMAAVICMLPFCSPLLILGIPFGIWAFVVLMNRDVKLAFAN